jgi:hypothetical protein
MSAPGSRAKRSSSPVSGRPRSLSIASNILRSASLSSWRAALRSGVSGEDSSSGLNTTIKRRRRRQVAIARRSNGLDGKSGPPECPRPCQKKIGQGSECSGVKRRECNSGAGDRDLSFNPAGLVWSSRKGWGRVDGLHQGRAARLAMRQRRTLPSMAAIEGWSVPHPGTTYGNHINILLAILASNPTLCPTTSRRRTPPP